MDLTLFSEIILGLLVFVVFAAIWCDQLYSRRIVLPKISEQPMFLALRVPPCEDGNCIRFSTRDGKLLQGTYFKTTARERIGVVVFCHEFLANRWSFQIYADGLRESGFDLFAFDFRNHGDSDLDDSHPSLPWLTDREYMDLEAALDYLGSRPDSDGTGYALFGVSRGGSTALALAAKRADVWAVITDGAFPTLGTLIPYMMRFATLYVRLGFLVELFPNFLYRFVGYRGLIYAEHKYGCKFLHLESLVGKIAPRPWLAIHGQSDNYITPEIAKELFAQARQPKQMWIVPKAKHNRSQQLQPVEYKEKITGFLRSNAPSVQLSVSPNTVEPTPETRTQDVKSLLLAQVPNI